MPRYNKVTDNIPSVAFWDLDEERKVHVENLQFEVTTETTVLLKPHRLGHYAIRFCTSGSGRIFIDHIPYNIEENWIMLATPDQISWLEIPENAAIQISVIAFTKDLIDLMGFAEDATSYGLGMSSHLIVRLDKTDVNIVKKYFALIRQEFEQHTEPPDRILAALIKALLLRLYSTKLPIQKPDKVLQKYFNIYRQYLTSLSENYRKKHYVADYVELMHISEKQLNRACKAITNRTARQIIQQWLDFEAKRLLYYTSNTVKEVGYHLGFKDPAHFNKFFKKLNQITPRHFRMQH